MMTASGITGNERRFLGLPTRLTLLLPLLFIFIFIIVLITTALFCSGRGVCFDWWRKLDLPVNSRITDYFFPKAKNKEDLNRFQPQSLYWFYRENGYQCGIEGQLLSDDHFEWKLMTRKGQEVRLNLNGPGINYYLRHPYYNEDKGEWAEDNRVTDPSYFRINDYVRVVWDCPIEDPAQMIDDKGMINAEYLRFIPVSVSRATDENN